ncbi:uncharacterized protein LOC124154480 [Ischnura elegans]|uniref:uncharacterized protein LOC124154480 n=1 Tax=Ischnura elegans TaxID=197161 RepID=UPI001ED87CE1|nr:uncharacterized protein LOC124154480 [Ischnura elegans]
MVDGHDFDSRWTVRDKIKHYRGLISLREREKENDRKEFELESIQTSQKLNDLKKEVRWMRIERKNEVAAAFLRNIIQDDRRLALSLGDRCPTDLVNEMRQRTCVKQREMNKLLYLKSIKMKELENNMVEIELLKERIAMYSTVVSDTSQEILNKEIENTKVKYYTAKSVQSAYKKMIGLMREDSFYLDHILSALLRDANGQSQIIKKVNEKREKAAEQNLTARAELQLLEEKTVSLMRMRDRAIRHLRQQINLLKARLKNPEVEEVFGTSKMFKLEMLTQVNEEDNEDTYILHHYTLHHLEKGLKDLQEVTMVTDYRNIYGRLQDQLEQRQHLIMKVATCEKDRRSLCDKRDCLKESLQKLQHTYSEECKRQEGDEVIYRNELLQAKDKTEELDRQLQEMTVNIFDMRAVIITLHEIVGRVRTPDEVEQESEPVSDLTFKEIMSQIADPFETLEKIKEKVGKLRHEIGIAVENWPATGMGLAEKELKETKEVMPPEMNEILSKDPLILNDARKEYHNKVIEHIGRTHFGGTAPYLYPLDEVKDVEAGVASRAEIKMASRRIVKDYEVLTMGFGGKKGSRNLHRRKKIRRRKLTI